MLAPSPEPIRDVLEEHLDEAAFLWVQREAALASPRYTVGDVAEGVEERLLAHLAGLSLGGALVEEELLAPALGEDDMGRLAAAAAALAARGRVDRVLSALRSDAPAAIGRAVALFLPAGDHAALLRRTEEDGPAAAVALQVLASRGAAPASSIRRALASSDAGLIAVALRAAVALGDAARSEIEAAWGSPLPALHDAAVEAGLALGLRGAWGACQRAAEAGSPTALDLLVLGVSGDRGDLGRIAAATRVPATRSAALFAAGFSGRVEAADLCVAHLDDPAAAAVAGEAFGAVTGLVIEGLYAAPAPEDEDPDDLVSPPPAVGPEAELPLPDAPEVASWWKGNRPRFPEGQRHVAGRPWAAEELLRAFAAGPTRRRGAIGRELAVRSRGQYRIDTAALAGDQVRLVRTLQLVARVDFGQPFEKVLRG